MIQYKQGKDNVPTNALSRSLSLAISTPDPKWLQDLRKENMTNEELK